MASKTLTEQLVLPLLEAINQIPVLLWFPLSAAFVGFALLLVSCSFAPSLGPIPVLTSSLRPLGLHWSLHNPSLCRPQAPNSLPIRESLHHHQPRRQCERSTSSALLARPLARAAPTKRGPNSRRQRCLQRPRHRPHRARPGRSLCRDSRLQRRGAHNTRSRGGHRVPRQPLRPPHHHRR